MKNFRLIFVLVLLLAHAAFAVIQLKLPVSKIYSTSSPVDVAKITALNPANRSIEAQSDSDKLRLHLVQPQALFASLKVGDPVVVFIAKGRASNTATVHLADTWLLANLKPESKIWEITQEQSNDFRKAFPGSTKALTQIVAEFRDNKSSLMSAAEERLFTEGASQIAQLNITANNVFTADLNADNIPELIISTPHGPRIFSKSTDTFADTTANWSLPAAGSLLAVGDLNSDGKPDLIIDKRLTSTRALPSNPPLLSIYPRNPISSPSSSPTARSSLCPSPANSPSVPTKNNSGSTKILRPASPPFSGRSTKTINWPPLFSPTLLSTAILSMAACRISADSPASSSRLISRMPTANSKIQD